MVAWNALCSKAAHRLILEQRVNSATKNSAAPTGQAREPQRGQRSKSLTEWDSDVVVSGKILKTASLRGEWYLDVDQPETILKELKARNTVPDIFTFWQRLPRTEPEHSYFMEWDNVTAIPIVSYQDWWTNRTDKNARRAVKRAEKKGIQVRTVPFDDELLRGIAEIFNEVPIRQGKPMRHYGKQPEQLRQEYLPELARTTFIGAFFEGRLIGFMMLLDAGTYANIAQIMSKIEHRDKAPNNALIASAVRLCEAKRIPFLVYTKLYKQGVTEFKRRNGFERFDLPRYYIPLSWKGHVACSLGLHKGVRGVLPDRLLSGLLTLRSKWYSVRYGKDFIPSSDQGRELSAWHA
jgi:hypothetical protein